MTTIEPNKNIINFWLGNQFAKEKNIKNSRKNIRIVSERNFGSAELHKVDVDIPDTTEVDYDDIQKFKCARNGGVVEKFKDGVLVFCDENVKILQSLTISFYKNENTNTPMQHFISINNLTEFFLDPRDIDFYDSIKDDFNLYVAYKKGFKNKVFHFNLKNNEAVVSGIERLKNYLNFTADKDLKMLSVFFDDDHIKRFTESLGVLDKFESIKDAIDNKMVDSNEYVDTDEKNIIIETGKNLLNSKISKSDVLKAGFEVYFINKIVSLCSILKSIITTSSEEELKRLRDNYKFCKEVGFDKNILKDPEGISSRLKNFIQNVNFDYAKAKPVLRKLSDKIIKERRKNKGNDLSVNIDDILVQSLYLTTLLKETEFGTKLPGIGKIDLNNRSYMDCFLFWEKLRLFNLLQNNIEVSDFPIVVKDGQIYNDSELYEEVYKVSKDMAIQTRNTEYTNETCDVIEEDTLDKIKETLKESINQESGLLIPHNACVEIPDDFVFKYARFIESENYITIFLHDEKDRYATEMFVKNEEDFRYWLFNEHQLINQQSPTSISNLYLKLASCIRDWKVLVERDRTMTCRGHRVPKEVDTERKRWFYLPRVRYNRSVDKEQNAREKIFYSESRKFSGERREHRRKLPTGMKPSKAQIVLAESRGLYIPEGHTYVRKSVWGKLNKSTREVKYRSKSLHGLLFNSNTDQQNLNELINMGPGGFEEHCEKYVERLGYQVYKKWNYDGGIDIRGIKEDGSRLFAQCKHYLESGNPIGPDVVRELKGSSDLERQDIEDCKIELMVITSTRYTHKAQDAAAKLGIKLVRTDEME